jgi:hypothetical protein
MCQALLSFFLLLLVVPALSVETPRDLSRYRNKNRLLLVFAPSASDPRWARQEALLAGSRAKFTDRDLLRLDLFERGGSRGAGASLASSEAAALRARYHVGRGRFRVLLIGKDGHVAFGGPTPVSLSDLTERIDRMPMRRDEMRRGEREAR